MVSILSNISNGNISHNGKYRSCCTGAKLARFTTGCMSKLTEQLSCDKKYTSFCFHFVCHLKCDTCVVG